MATAELKTHNSVTSLATSFRVSTKNDEPAPWEKTNKQPNFKPEAEEVDADPTAAVRGSRGTRRPTCRVPTCCMDLSSARPYCQKYRICEEHQKALFVEIDGKEMRFCQQCGRMHYISSFDGARRSCRDQLSRHNKRLREQRHMRNNKEPPSSHLNVRHSSMMKMRKLYGDELTKRYSNNSDGSEGSVMTQPTQPSSATNLKEAAAARGDALFHVPTLKHNHSVNLAEQQQLAPVLNLAAPGPAPAAPLMSMLAAAAAAEASGMGAGAAMNRDTLVTRDTLVSRETLVSRDSLVSSALISGDLGLQSMGILNNNVVLMPRVSQPAPVAVPGDIKAPPGMTLAGWCLCNTGPNVNVLMPIWAPASEVIHLISAPGQ
mmetsp:Transcript_11598/g.24886  ORF Transcript_11598/g.24886 Transcript_11598/m.24886 type:complete len:375 (+) Transcript_11598:341-1465(+)|eukprot:CAMPEP_0202902388 /NCGR_PEP_ID=MMETSP1392-20130828/16824_1 /ASSEMBLY_ACC=CAM_ASM_000868 /TAXON_ID=225041 /ORGANISM="Chlamydomonas chlamydogama, Strain SAG 11-48b" /LENGTH=374 /DNA_ID=CAMNT_0049589143 /DNA_START=341 /DNA_END=1465 /DNA_ORIENTATION=-